MPVIYPHGYSCICPSCLAQDAEIINAYRADLTEYAIYPSLPVEPPAATGMDVRVEDEDAGD